MFKVLKGIPLPKTNRGDLPPRQSKYPYALLEIGDMFFIPNKTKNTLSTHTSTIGKKLDRRFSTRLTYMKFVDADGDLVETTDENGFWAAAKEGDEGAVLGIGVWRVEPKAEVVEDPNAAPADEQETPEGEVTQDDEEDDAAAALTAPKRGRRKAAA